MLAHDADAGYGKLMQDVLPSSEEAYMAKRKRRKGMKLLREQWKARKQAGKTPDPDPLFLDRSSLEQQLHVLLLKPTDELERLATDGGGEFPLKLV
jgi:hypothetical protein